MNDIFKAVNMMLEYVDQNVPISTVKSHIGSDGPL